MTTDIAGHLSWDATLRHGRNGRPWIRLGLVTTDGRQAIVKAFDTLAVTTAGLRSGTDIVATVGPARICEWTDTQGVKRSDVEYVAHRITVVDHPSHTGAVDRILRAESTDVLDQ
ncbi:hypothetical protein GHK86_08220 [Acidimicrobiaceae bacterium USS-CC1]|uniref:Single-stranded DNA-binding protein n=1 Tax=Acidiferrimicrobium australe TaxID=2664430 RepID=A0ABW9QT27_9ACTN|nr:hypothetical protein [Acidiferrimicrobium australe]